jgi:hypothetical protein
MPSMFAAVSTSCVRVASGCRPALR